MDTAITPVSAAVGRDAIATIGEHRRTAATDRSTDTHIRCEQPCSRGRIRRQAALARLALLRLLRIAEFSLPRVFQQTGLFLRAAGVGYLLGVLSSVSPIVADGQKVFIQTF